jgi:hypothetical protein
MSLRHLLTVTAALTVFSAAAQGQNLLIDFNSSQGGPAENEAGYQAYDADHEVPASFGPRPYSAFGTSVSVTPAWPNTTADTVQQAIDRGAGNDANWLGNNISLLTDWIGSDSRTGNGGNGDWARDGTSDPTYMTLTLSGLPAGPYSWLSYHHDTENMWSDFQIEVSIDGGATYSAPLDLQMTSSTPGGTPDSATGTGLGPIDGSADPDPANLPSTAHLMFSADGTNDVVFRFAPFADGVDDAAVHKQFFGMNGFAVARIPEPSTIALCVLTGIGLLPLFLKRRQA